MKRLANPARLLLAMLCLPLLLSLLPQASAVSQLNAESPRFSLEGRLLHFVDPGGALEFENVTQAAFVAENFVRLPGYRSLGYDTDTHWFHAKLDPAADAPTRWVLEIGTAELDELDVWVQLPDGGYRHAPMGYTRPYQERPLHARLFALPVDVFPGMQVFLRVRTTNAISVHAELWQPQAWTAQEARGNFLRGGYFGILLIATVLYLILGARLRDGVMLAYTGYLAGQLMYLLGANGYLPVLAGSSSDGAFTDALQRSGWVLWSVCILLMWDRLLELKQRHPWLHRLFLFSACFQSIFLLFALWPTLVNDAVLTAVELANVLSILNFAISMALLLTQWWRSRRVELLIYLLAFAIPVLGNSLSSSADLGRVAWNVVTANAMQAAVLVHVLVMSYGLALRLRQLQYDKVAAEQEVTAATRRAEEQRRFVAMLSHEFGNPLAAIDRAAQMVQIKAKELPIAEAQRLAQIRSNAAILSRLVDNFLMTEALDHNALVPSRESCSIRELLEEVIRLLGDPARERIVLREYPDATFDLDPTLISIAVGNLLANALRYSPPESFVEISALLSDTGLQIRIADRGPGMSDDELDRLGTPYFRATSSLGKKGSGLGYHFTQRIVEAHGGVLTATSRESSGLIVEMLLPE